MASRLLSGKYADDDVKYACGALYGAGTDTTLSTIKTVLLAMMMFPEVQARVQEEIDGVLGPIENAQRLPEFEDRESLPYLNALIKEALRWHPAVPLGIQHSSIEDDVFQGYYIPKDSIIFANQWAMSRDEAFYDNPEEFRPERFLGPDPALDPYQFAFGFGRRICVGLHFADAAVYIMAASILAAFTISKPIGDNGEVLEPIIPEAHAGLDAELQCRLVPRSQSVAALIRSTYDGKA